MRPKLTAGSGLPLRDYGNRKSCVFRIALPQHGSLPTLCDPDVLYIFLVAEFINGASDLKL
jgi:hypothetical protein